MMNGRAFGAAAALVCGAVLVACSGGGSSQSYIGRAAPPAAVPTAPLALTVVRPLVNGQSAARRPRALSSETKSITVAVVETGVAPAPVVINVYVGAPNCTTSGSQLSCTGTVSAPVGTDSFVITAFAQPNAQGAVLSTGSIVIAVGASGAAATANAATLALNSVETSATLIAAPNPLTLVAGVNTVAVTAQAYDATGAIIVGPGGYTYPVTITLDATAPFTFADGSPTQVNGPGQSVTLRYIDGSLPSGANTVHIGGAVNGVPVTPASLQVIVPAPSPTPTPPPDFTPPPPTAPPTPTAPPPQVTPTPGAVAVTPNVINFLSPTAAPAAVTVSEAGQTAFTAVSSDATVATVSGSGAAFTVTPHGAGTCTVTFADGANGTGTLLVTVTAVTISPSEKKRNP